MANGAFAREFGRGIIGAGATVGGGLREEAERRRTQPFREIQEGLQRGALERQEQETERRNRMLGALGKFSRASQAPQTTLTFPPEVLARKAGLEEFRGEKEVAPIFENIQEQQREETRQREREEDKQFKLELRDQQLELAKLKDQRAVEKEIAKLQAKQEFKRSLPIFEQLGQSDKDQINLINNSFGMLDRVAKKVEKLEPGKVEGFLRALRGEKEVLKDPELQSLFSAYTLLSQSLTKQIQGSRPSDYDALIFEKATGKRALSKENMIAALNEVGGFARDNFDSFVNGLSQGLRVDRGEIENLFLDVTRDYQPITVQPEEDRFEIVQ